MPTSISRVFCFGGGFLARHLVALLTINSIICLDTHREPREGSAVFRSDARMDEEAEQFLFTCDAVLISVPPDQSGDPVYRHYVDYFRTMPNLKWIGYCSSTAVYGDCNGAWVDEDVSVKPMSERGKARALAEMQWLKTDLPVHIFRLAGIYGKGRSALDQAAQNTARVTKHDHVMNRIHVVDAARAMAASMHRPRGGAIYNLSDDMPASRDEVLVYAYHLLDKTPPEPVAWNMAELSPMARSFFEESKRVRAEKIKRDTGIDWLYPDYKTGLDACL